MVTFTAARNHAVDTRDLKELTPAFLLAQGEPQLEEVTGGYRLVSGDYALILTEDDPGAFSLSVLHHGDMLYTLQDSGGGGGGGGYGEGFVLILVLFILLVIVGAGFGSGNSGFVALLGEDGLAGLNGLDSLAAIADDDILGDGSGTSPIDTSTLFSAKDRIHGSDRDDRLYGFADDDTIRGHKGDDRIAGGKGDDILRGGKGDDRIAGGKGDDNLFGGAGSDRFVFKKFGRDSGLDRIHDFADGKDTFYLKQAAFSDLAKGPLGAGAFAAHFGVRDDGTIVYRGADASGALARVDKSVAHLIDHTDFVVF